MKRYLTLAILVLLAVSCGGRRGHKDADGAQEDSLATAIQEKPKSTPADSLADLKKPIGMFDMAPAYILKT